MKKIAIVGIALALLLAMVMPGVAVAGGPTEWTLVETVEVPANSSTSQTLSPMLEAKIYKIEAVGTYKAGDTIIADAEYSLTQRIIGDTWTNVVSGYEIHGDILLDLTIDGKNIDWGAYNENHVYNHYRLGNGEAVTLALVIYDIYYPNNVGSLTVNVYEFVGKKIVTYFGSTEIDTAIRATFLPTGDGGWQEWQFHPDGTERHLVFKPTTKPQPKGDYWFHWTSHSYPQPAGTIPLEYILPYGSTWWVNLPPD